MGRKEKDCPASRKKYRKGIVFILLFVLIAVIVGAAGSSLTEAKVQKAQKTDPDYVNMENSGCGIMELNRFCRFV